MIDLVGISQTALYDKKDALETMLDSGKVTEKGLLSLYGDDNLKDLSKEMYDWFENVEEGESIEEWRSELEVYLMAVNRKKDEKWTIEDEYYD